MKALSGLVFVVGLIICVIGLALFGAAALPSHSYFTDWVVSAEVVLMGVVTLSATFALFRSHRLTSFIYFGGAAIEAVCALWIRLSKIDSLIDTAIWGVLASTLFVLLGIFYRLAHQHNWPFLFDPARPSWKRKIAGVCVGCVMFILIAILSVRFGISHGSAIDCSGASSFAQPTNPNQAVFVARLVVLKGWPAKLVDLEQLPLGIVQQHFWGLPFWDRKIVLIGLPLPPGETYFIDGKRMSGLLTQFLPVVEFKPCSRSRQIEYAEVDLRVLHDGPPKSGIRIIGSVIRMHSSILLGAAGVEVAITGPSGTVIVQTDSHGIYDVSGLPPGQYAINTNAKTSRGWGNSCQMRTDTGLRMGDVWGCELRID